MKRAYCLLLSGTLLILMSVLPASGATWQQSLEKAKTEGKVAVLGPVGADVRHALTQPFERKYGISVEYVAIRGAEMVTRLRTERDAGRYLWDVYVSGTTTALTGLKPMGALDPIEPSLILPEVKDGKNWLGGKLWFADKDHFNMIIGLATWPAFAINPTLVKAQEFNSYRDLLNPKWQGKILVARDPRQPGPGQATFTHFFLHKDLGPEFIRSLSRQELTILRDDRQAMDWLGQGKFPIALGAPETITDDLMKKGVPIELIPPQQLREGGGLTPGPASVALMNRAPQPNAGRVYLNWLLSKEGQAEFTKATGVPSLRVDAPGDHLVSWRRPVIGYVDIYSEDALASKDPLLELLKEVLKK